MKRAWKAGALAVASAVAVGVVAASPASGTTYPFEKKTETTLRCASGHHILLEVIGSGYVWFTNLNTSSGTSRAATFNLGSGTHDKVWDSGMQRSDYASVRSTQPITLFARGCS